jgi:hypothetical protein
LNKAKHAMSRRDQNGANGAGSGYPLGFFLKRCIWLSPPIRGALPIVLATVFEHSATTLEYS